MIDLVVADDGNGMTNDFDLEKSDNLGIKLVNELTRELQGTITHDGSNGTRYHVSFPQIGT